MILPLAIYLSVRKITMIGTAAGESGPPSLGELFHFDALNPRTEGHHPPEENDRVSSSWATLHHTHSYPLSCLFPFSLYSQLYFHSTVPGKTTPTMPHQEYQVSRGGIVRWISPAVSTVIVLVNSPSSGIVRLLLSGSLVLFIA